MNTVGLTSLLNSQDLNFNKAYSAFEQFEIIRLVPFHLFGNLDLSITNSTLFMFITLAFFYFLYTVVIKDTISLVPGR